MILAIIGASGFVGRALVKAALLKGHQVIAISRSGIFEPNSGLKNMHVDVFSESNLKDVLSSSELVISAYNSGWNNPNLYEDYMNGSKHIINVCREIKKHVIFVGGASSLLLPNGEPLFSQIGSDLKEKVRGTFDLLHILRNDLSFKWTFVSPASEIIPSDQHDTYNIGGDYLLYGHNGKSQITVGDLALFCVTEALREEHIHKRLTIARV